MRQDQDRDTRDYRDDRNQERERERPPRREDERDTAPSPSMSQTVQDALETVVNTDSVILDADMVRAINDPAIRMTRNGDLTRLISNQFSRANLVRLGSPKKRSRMTKYRRAYNKAFRACKPKHIKKNGTWKMGGFKRCVREAHAKARKQLK